MHQSEFVSARRTRLHKSQMFGYTRDIKQILDAALTRRTFSRLIGLNDAAPRLQESGQRRGVVPHQQFVPDETGGQVRMHVRSIPPALRHVMTPK